MTNQKHRDGDTISGFILTAGIMTMITRTTVLSLSSLLHLSFATLLQHLLVTCSNTEPTQSSFSSPWQSLLWTITSCFLSTIAIPSSIMASRWCTSTRRAPFAPSASGRSPKPRACRPQMPWTTSFMPGETLEGLENTEKVRQVVSSQVTKHHVRTSISQPLTCFFAALHFADSDPLYTGLQSQIIPTCDRWEWLGTQPVPPEKPH